MNLNKALNYLLEEYPKALSEPFKGNEVANYIRKDIPEFITKIIDNNDRYIVKGSPGKGNWANVPWIAVLDRFITETVQDGYYVVYLIKEDFSGIYLSLNQGVTTVKKQYGSDAKNALQIRANDYLAKLGNLSNRYFKGPIDLATTNKSTLGPLYEVGSICSFYYSADKIPNDNILENDLKEILNIYFLLVNKENQLFNLNEMEDDEINVEYENLKKIRIHKRIERNQRLSKKVKKLKGYTCEACGFNFEKEYEEIGKEFIEAHHLTPLHKIEVEKVALNPVKDFAVLCANCHRMIHRSEFVSDIKKFKVKYIKK